MVSKKEGKKQNNKSETDEARNNLLGFFSLFLKVDRRVNPQKYKPKNGDGIKKRQDGFHIRIFHILNHSLIKP